MNAVFSIILGVLIVFISYLVFLREMKKSRNILENKYSFINDENTKEILKGLNRVDNIINDLNRAFYDIVSDLEGKYSIHDKEMELLHEKFEIIEKKIIDLELTSKNSKKKIEIIEKKEKVSTENLKYKNIKEIHQDTKSICKKQDTELIYEKQDVDEKNANQISSNSKNEYDNLKLSTLNNFEKELIRKKIIELRRNGYTLSQIAKKLEIGIGELQLVLNIKKSDSL